MTKLDKSKSLESAFDSPTFEEDGSFYLDKPVGSASISPCGRDIVLASRQGLHIIDLDSPWSPPRYLPHHTVWDVADVQWSPFAARDHWIVSTSSQKALIWNMAMASPQASIEHVLDAHTRAVTDVNFSAHHPDVLATCAVDSYVHCWDLRHPIRPAMTYCDWFAGATQVKWNRQDPHILASSHDKFLRIWDDRKGAYPLRSITAHSTKIYGVDWNRTDTQHVATCSLDKTIKFWNYTSEMDEPVWTIYTQFPVHRARHTPFGSGLLAMPQRNDYNLYLYDRRKGEAGPSGEAIKPVYRFDGHVDQVKEFLWRPRGTVTDDIDNREFQLVSWGSDRMLRLHRIDEKVLQDVGFEKGETAKGNISITRTNATYRTFREGAGQVACRRMEASSGDGHLLGDTFASTSHAPLSSGMGAVSMGYDPGMAEISFNSMNGMTPNERQNNDTIAWMRGVKLGKRKTPSSVLDLNPSSNLSPSLKADRTWDVFESLGEEITHVGDKFRKIVFNEIDVSKRFITVSFSGPKGPSGNPAFIKARISFPIDYPQLAVPHVKLENSALIGDEIVQKVTSEVKTLSNGYLSLRKNSLEAILRYLLGEQTVADSLQWLKECTDQDNLDLNHDPSLSSSDEDDVSVGNFENSDAQTLDASDLILRASNSQYNVPIPKACGALWSNDGHLVCFFPPKEETPRPFFEVSLKGNEKSLRIYSSRFGGFGQLQTGAHMLRRIAHPLESHESDSSESEDQSTLSSPSSLSSGVIDESPQHLLSSAGWPGSAFEAQHTILMKESQKSNGGTGFSKSVMQSTGNFVSIHDCRDLIPSKIQLAQQYLLKGSDCCARNFEAALKSGNQELADAWEFLGLILEERVPLDLVHPSRQDEPVLIMSRRPLPIFNKEDSAVDLTFDMESEAEKQTILGSIKWACHPFGNWLIDKIIHYYQQSGDVQMLAMISCVLEAKNHALTGPRKGKDEGIYACDPATQHCPFYQRESTNYFPYHEVAESVLKPGMENERTESRKAINISQSANSSDASNGNPLTPFSAGGTPPSIFRSSRSTGDRMDSLATSISASPEQHRQTHRSSSNLASSFAASFSRPFSFSASASSSPPTTYFKKRVSPIGSYTAPTSSGVAWGIRNSFNKSLSVLEDPRSGFSLSFSDTEEDGLLSFKPTMDIKLKNQDQFHNDGYSAVPLLDPSKDWQYRAYRESYAHMLHVWNMPMTRCEILKYNYAPPSSPPSLSQSFAPSPLTIGKSAVSATPEPDVLELDLRQHCPKCSAILPPSTSRNGCGSCTTRRPPLVCLFCASVIRGLASPCLFCGHVLHAACRFAISSMFPGGVSPEEHPHCISGCGCDCTSHISVEVEFPDHRNSSGSVGTTGNTTVELVGPLDWNQADEDVWGDMAYESLARNLGKRYLTPKTSQIWRGGG